MSLQDIVKVTISTTKGGIARAGFGVAMILSYKPTWVERSRTYSDPDDLLADGFTTNDPEYKAASALWSADEHPETFVIGRGTNKPTQRWKITVVAVANSTDYRVEVNGQIVTHTSSTSATNDNIIAGIVSAISGLSGLTFTTTSQGTTGSKYAELLSNAAGNWNAIRVLDETKLSIEQDHADPGIAADLAAIQNENGQWYALVTLYNSRACVLSAAAWIETKKKIYIAATQDSTVINVAASSSTDVAKTASDADYARTAIVYHSNNGAFIDAGWFGVCLPFDPGSETWKFKTIAGVLPSTLTDTHLVNLKAKSCNYYVDYAGRSMVTEGIVAANEFIDVIRFRDWFEAGLSERIVQKLADAKKIAMDDGGLAIIQGETLAQLDEGVEVGGLVEGTTTCTVPKRTQIPVADRNARKASGIKFGGTLAGAIHSLDIKGSFDN